MSQQTNVKEAFDPSWPHQDPWSNAEIEPDEVFYYFEGPMVFTAKVGPFSMLFSKIDEIETGDLFVVSIVDTEIVKGLRDCTLSLFGAIAADFRFVAEMKGMELTRIWACQLEDVGMRRLPVRGVACSPGFPKVPDVLEGRARAKWQMRRVRHVARGSSYTVFAEGAHVQAAEPIREGDRVAVYYDDVGEVWVRPVGEFNDGRFTAE